MHFVFILFVVALMTVISSVSPLFYNVYRVSDGAVTKEAVSTSC
jgi:hypothetical protein